MQNVVIPNGVGSIISGVETRVGIDFIQTAVYLDNAAGILFTSVPSEEGIRREGAVEMGVKLTPDRG